MADSVLTLKPWLLLEVHPFPAKAPAIAPAAASEVLRMKVLRESLSSFIGSPYNFRAILTSSLILNAVILNNHI